MTIHLCVQLIYIIFLWSALAGGIEYVKLNYLKYVLHANASTYFTFAVTYAIYLFIYAKALLIHIYILYIHQSLP